MTEIAEAALVSRSTAYRYFPDLTALLREVIELDYSSAVERVESAPDDDPHARIDALVEGDYENRRANRAVCRAIVRLSMEERERGERSVPRGRRLELIEEALRPVRERLGPDVHRRLSLALSLVVGTEALLVLEDVLGLEECEADDVAQWTAGTLLDAALDEGEVKPRSSARRRPRARRSARRR